MLRWLDDFSRLGTAYVPDPLAYEVALRLVESEEAAASIEHCGLDLDRRQRRAVRAVMRGSAPALLEPVATQVRDAQTSYMRPTRLPSASMRPMAPSRAVARPLVLSTVASSGPLYLSVLRSRMVAVARVEVAQKTTSAGTRRTRVSSTSTSRVWAGAGRTRRGRLLGPGRPFFVDGGQYRTVPASRDLPSRAAAHSFAVLHQGQGGQPAVAEATAGCRSTTGRHDWSRYVVLIAAT